MSLDSSLDGDRPPSRRSSSSSSDRQKSDHSSPDRQKSVVDGETEPVAKKLTPRSSERDSSPDGTPYHVLFSLEKWYQLIQENKELTYYWDGRAVLYKSTTQGSYGQGKVKVNVDLYSASSWTHL